MYNHAPPGYTCPFCLLLQGIENGDTQLRQSDIIHQTANATAVMALKKWPNNAGHVLVISNEHFENIYDLPLFVISEIHWLGRRIALAMKEVYKCDGILFKQSNEPAGDQQIWHYHLHVIPRYQNDDFHRAQKEPFPANLRAAYASKLTNFISLHEETN